ncbi:TonB-dependent receptor [Sphingomonas floccifaciens]|uniref:TonB-dependent receptor n=1 Tax=Sphingomonas floccifaciens TaxID=1844115 RepID=A0ABW4N8H1_9SPHN
MTDRNTQRRKVAATTSWMALGLVLAFGPTTVAAQTTSQAAPQTGAPDPAGSAVDDTTAQEVLVVGSRASQQSANQRKKDARTATDSIVADDIGSFPDRNVNEAISRVPGVALSRNEFGEGDGVAIRGNGPDLTRVELDGIGVQATNALAIPGQGSRGADLRELPAELVKTVDIVKGATADMTEGSLGGTVQIKTRTGLDFKRPYLSVRGGTQANSLGKNWTPDANAVAATKLFDDRLGIIVSGSYAKIQNNGHSYENTTSNTRGFSRLFDFDNSPDKTFTYNPATVGTDAADVAFANSIAPDGTTLTPRELVTLAAGAKSKAECLTIFPFNPNGSAAQRAQRTLEQQSCLNQWNDATPSLIRNFMSTQNDQRYSFDGRVDYRLTDNLTIFAKGTIANRDVRDQFRTRSPVTMFNQNVTGTFVDTTTGYPRTRSVSASGAASGYYLFDPQYGLNNVSNNAVLGNVLNVVPSSVKVDANHNVTEMTLTNNSVTIDQIENRILTKTKYAQGGAEWRSDRVEADLWAGYTRAQTSRGDMRTSRAYTYGNATIRLQPNGLYDIDLPAGYDETAVANFVQLRPATAAITAAAPSFTNPTGTTAYTIAQQPLTTPSFQVTYTPALGVASEMTGKFDLGWKTRDLIPFISRIKTGAMYRRNDIKRWGNGGYTVSSERGTYGTAGYVPAVVVPTAIVRGSFRACEPTSTSTQPCNYGFVPSTNPSSVRSGVDTLTPAQLRDLFARTLEAPDSQYFGDLPNRGNLPPSWQGIRTDELFQALGANQFINADCLITCTGSDGKTYEQPVTRANETIKNVYAMADFETRLPWGMRFDGNVGLRGVFVDVKASGLQTIQAIRVTSTYNPLDPNNSSGFVTQTFSAPLTVNRSTRDWLPSFNANLWGFNDSVVLRFYGSKTVARPRLDFQIPSGSCIAYDEREVLDPGVDDFACTQRVGNPGLKPFTAWSYNTALEWYANADTLFSVAYGKLDVKIGNPIQVTAVGRPFAGSDAKDPVTGAALADLEFTYPTYDNGPGYKRDIWEFNAKTAFTFLPWIFKHTGVDANLSILASSVTTGQQDPLTGDVMPPVDESRYYINTSLWYDDGKFNFRLAYQKRSSRFSCITPCPSGNTTDINYPGEQWANVRLVAPGWNPGVPRFIDGSTFIDAKMSYNLNRNFQIYVEGRNLTREAQTVSTGKYVQFADGTPKIMRLQYGGMRVLIGARAQFGGK